MDKQQLITKILTEVKDPTLRDRLLAQVAEAEPAQPSRVLAELSSLGIDPEAARNLAGFHFKTQIIIGYLVGGLFFVGGGLVALANLFAGSLAGALFPGFFAAMGAYALAATRRLARLKKIPVQPQDKET
ncbi:hypothetical protein [Azovibrio restrictus]|uniref:hypothetical protein n=1 Tax=Azovibrio restrictus TaxID=146938 RepID=UPI0026E9E52E|nr:hypothetical protein [Azovibrio restrictus]